MPREERDPRSLKAAEHNVRVIDAGHVREVANAINALGFSVPVLIDADGIIIDGVVRAEAAKLLNLPLIPCVVAGHLDQRERDLLRIASNRLGEKGTWALDELQIVFEQLVLDEAPIEVSGFDLVEIDGILSEAEPAAAEEGPLVPDLTHAAIARHGDIFLLGPHRVICGDALDAKSLYRLMAGSDVKMVLTDEPYNVQVAGNVTRGDHREFAMASGEMSDEQFLAFNECWIRNVLGYLVEGGVLATFIDWRGLATVTNAARGLGLSQINLVVWGKTNAAMGSLYRSQHELLPIFKKGISRNTNNVKLGKTGRSRSNLWTYAGASSMGSDARRGLEHHPTVKPVAMLSDAMLDMSDRGDVVLDPFLGSGSTLIAAEKTGRVCRGIELDPLYVDLIVRRYQEVTGMPAVLEETRESFADLTTRRALEAQEHSAEAKIMQPAPSSEPQSARALANREFRKRTRASAAA